MSESSNKKKNAIQEYNAEIANENEDGPDETKGEIFTNFAAKKPNPQDAETETREAAKPGLRAELIKIKGENIRHKNEMGVLQQQLDQRDAALDHVKSVEDKAVHKVAKRNGIIFESDLEGTLSRKILFKLTNYILIAGGLIIALMSGSNPSIQLAINNLTKNTIEFIGLLAFISLDIYIFFTWYRKQ